MAKKKWLLLIIMIASISAHAQYTASHNFYAVTEAEMGIDSVKTDPRYWAGFNISNTLVWPNGLMVDLGGAYALSSKYEVKGTFNTGIGYKFTDWFNAKAVLKNGFATSLDSISFHNTKNDDWYYEYRKSPYYLVNFNLEAIFKIKDFIIGLSAGYNHYTPIGNINKTLGENWVLENSSIAPKNSLTLGLNVGYSIPNTVKKDGDNPFEFFAETGWNSLFGAKAGIATGYTWRMNYWLMLEASTGIDYYWQSQSLAANIKFGPKFAPWGYNSKVIFALYGQVAFGEYYGLKYNVQAENPERLDVGGLNNTLGLNLMLTPEVSLNLNRVGILFGCRGGYFFRSGFDGHNVTATVSDYKGWNIEPYLAIRIN
ncbi:MAG: hypothetical protein E7004_01785 [Alphaproteobacteria bacterium]|nr:hypothetical protein [Alphaproteobacteria bacterium]